MQHACRAHRNAVVSAGANRAVGWVRAPHHGGPRQAARSASVAVAGGPRGQVSHPVICDRAGSTDQASLAGLSVSQVGRIIAAGEWQGKRET